MPTLTGYSVPTLNDLLAIPEADRSNNLSVRVASERSWYQFNATQTIGLIPNDRPTTGRWMPDVGNLEKILTDTNGNVLTDNNGNILYII